MGSILGTIHGTVFMTLVPEILRILADSMSGLFPNMAAMLPQLKLFTFGFLIVFFLVYEPKGLVKIWNDIKNYWIYWPFKH